MSPVTAITPTAISPPQPAAGSRASWSGQLRLGPLTLPVKAYPALVVPSGGPLHQIHLACGERISQRKVCPQHGELTAAEIGKAFEFAPNDRLTLSTDELAALAPTEDETIYVEHLLPHEKFETALLSGRVLYLVPTHPAAESAYARAVALLGPSDNWAVGRMVLSDQRRVVAVRVENRRLLLYVLHFPEHRRACPAFDVDVAAIGAGELRALEKSLLPLHKSFAWEEYRDEGAERLNDLIATKIAARKAPREAPASKRAKATATAGVGSPRSRRVAA